mmetsp:Transcript_18715/g.33911  ORF Transcript_18715/g.33911 Transcript_18715/m.33911 type:complete len:282 (-) Transcript_18715:65-910(-)
MAGLLIVKPLSAKLTRDTELFGKMDPYCVVRLGEQSQKTAVAKKAGKLPFWRDQLVFRKKTEEEVVFEVWDHDSTTADDLVGEARLMLQEIGTKVHEGWIKLKYRGRSAGKLRISIEHRPEARGARSEPNLAAIRLEDVKAVEEEKKPARVLLPKPPGLGTQARVEEVKSAPPFKVASPKETPKVEVVKSAPPFKVASPKETPKVEVVKSAPPPPLKVAAPKAKADLPHSKAESKRSACTQTEALSSEASSQSGSDNSNGSCRITSPPMYIFNPNFRLGNR